MRVRQRPRSTLNNAWCVDCVTFMEYEERLRWREVEDFFPVDDDVESFTAMQIARLPHVDDSLVCNGSCGVHPDDAMMIKERHNLDYSLDLMADRLGLSLSQAAKFQSMMMDYHRNQARLGTAQERKVGASGYGTVLPPTPPPKDVVPLEGEFVSPGPEFQKAVAKETGRPVRKRNPTGRFSAPSPAELSVPVQSYVAEDRDGWYWKYVNGTAWVSCGPFATEEEAQKAQELGGPMPAKCHVEGRWELS